MLWLILEEVNPFFFVEAAVWVYFAGRNHHLYHTNLCGKYHDVSGNLPPPFVAVSLNTLVVYLTVFCCRQSHDRHFFQFGRVGTQPSQAIQ